MVVARNRRTGQAYGFAVVGEPEELLYALVGDETASGSAAEHDRADGRIAPVFNQPRQFLYSFRAHVVHRPVLLGCDGNAVFDCHRPQHHGSLLIVFGPCRFAIAHGTRLGAERIGVGERGHRGPWVFDEAASRQVEKPRSATDIGNRNAIGTMKMMVE